MPPSLSLRVSTLALTLALVMPLLTMAAEKPNIVLIMADDK